jgi:hypothetical protein
MSTRGTAPDRASKTPSQTSDFSLIRRIVPSFHRVHRRAGRIAIPGCCLSSPVLDRRAYAERSAGHDSSSPTRPTQAVPRGEQRAAYGEKLFDDVAASLTAEFGRGFGKRNLHHIIRFADVFQDREIVQALRAQLSWTHLRTGLRISSFAHESVDTHTEWSFRHGYGRGLGFSLPRLSWTTHPFNLNSLD